MTECADCGPVAVPHAMERWSTELDGMIDHIGKPMDAVWYAVKPAVDALRPGRLAPAFFRALAALRLGRIVAHPDEKNTWRAKVLWEEAEHRGIVMREFRPFGLSRELFFATCCGDTRCFDGLPRPRNAQGKALNWMDDKGVILARFAKAGIPVPHGGSVRSERDALQLFNNIRAEIGSRAAVIVKPALGSRSRHTYIHLTDTAAVIAAFRKAKEISSRVVIEEELPGFVFRVTLVGGKVAGIMRREPPHVMGDGRRTVRALIKKENENPLRRGPIFHELVCGPEAAETLKAQRLTLDDVPKRGRMVVLHPKVSRSFGASTTEIAMRDVHPDNLKLFLKIAATLDDPLVGVDFMMEDMARSWRTTRCGVIECNSLPFIDLHHFPYAGRARNVAGMVWDLAFGK